MKISHSIIFLLSFVFATCMVRAADFYAPAPFVQIMERPFAKSWTPKPVSAIADRSHILLLDAETQLLCLTVNSGNLEGLNVSLVSSLNDGTGTYGKVLRSMFQLQDLHIENQANSALSGTYTVRPELKIYFGIDANASSGSSTAQSLLVNRIKGVDLSDYANPGHLVFTFIGSPNSAKMQAATRFVYDSNSKTLVQDPSWSANHWIRMDVDGVRLVTSELEATVFYLATAFDLIDFSNPSGDGFNPTNINWQTNAFATWPTNPGTGQTEVSSIVDSALNGPNGMAFKDIDSNYREQFGSSSEAATVASAYLDQIEEALTDSGESLRYPKELYLTVRENMLSHTFGAVDEVNAELGESTIPYVYFTNAQDDSGVYHPFMVVGSRNGTGGPNFLIDVARPPGDGTSESYENSTITRNATLSSALFRIPLKDYGLIDNLLDNNMTPHNNLALDAGINISEYDVYNYASYSVCGLALDGVKIYPAYNNTLVFAPMNGEITSTGVHVGRGMGLHYHADGHSLNGNGINLYNLEDYEGRRHPPIIGFGMDGVAIYGKYETDYSSMDGYAVALDEYGGHDHDDYGYHYHAFPMAISKESKGVTYNFTQHFLMVGAYRGSINDIPGFQNGGTNQLKDSELGKYVGVKDSYVTTTFEISDSTPATYLVTVSESVGGSVAGAGSYQSGSTITLTATADSGYTFSGWGGDAAGASNPLSLTVDGNLTISAGFAANNLFSTASSLGNGWFSLSGSFGTYYASNATWIYHSGMGWLYPANAGQDSVWLYMPGRGWLYMATEQFPHLYDVSAGNWVYYSKINDQPSIYEYANQAWVLIE